MEKEKIKIYLQSPWKFPDSPYYKYLVSSPPRNVEFQNIKKQKGVITNKKVFWILNFLKRNIRRGINKLNLSLPNAHLSPEGNYDLIHCAHCLSKNQNKPWVADIESWWAMYLSGKESKKTQKKVLQIILSKNCKKIIPWTENTKKDILKTFPGIANKLEVVYPAIPEIKDLKKPRNKKLKIIFIARYFDLKGGIIALEVLERLRKNHNIEGIVVSDVPEGLKKKYSNLKIYDLIPQKKLFDLMLNSDIFLYPSFVDTFGFSLLEAMSFGLPTITLNRKDEPNSRKEIIEQGKTGFIVDVEEKLDLKKIGDYEEEIIKKLIEKTTQLLINNQLREKMSKECLKTIKKGKFSIERRNEKLEKIYGESIK